MLGVKNLLNWTPNRKSFYHSKSQRPFDKNVQYDSAGNAQVTPDNPYALTFDPGYVSDLTKVRSFFGLRYTKIILRQITNRNF
jgi:outer membrane receptor for ferrienterochelin and colicins